MKSTKPIRRVSMKVLIPILLLFNALILISIPGVKADVVSGFRPDIPLQVASWPQVEPSIAVNPANLNHLIAVYIDENPSTNQNCYTALSTDTAQTWQTPISLNNPFFCADPIVRFRSDGIAFLTYLMYTSGHSYIDLQISTTQGASWNNRVQIAATSSGSVCDVDKPWLAIDSANYIDYVTYTVGDCSNPEQTKISIARSTNGGGTWSTSDLSNYGSNIVGMSTVAVASNGDVLVSWVTSDSGTFGSGGHMTYNFRRSTDHGLNFSSPTTVITANQSPLTICGFSWTFWGTMAPKMITGPSQPGASAPYNTYLVYAARPTLLSGTCTPNSGTDEADVYFTKSTDGGASWSSPTDLTSGGATSNNNPDQFFPSIAVDANGVLHVTYADMGVSQTCPCNRYQILQTQSGDFGSDWSIPLPVSRGAYYSTTSTVGDYFDLTTSGSTVVAIWTDLRTQGSTCTSGCTTIYTASSYTIPTPPLYLRLMSTTTSSATISWSPSADMGNPLADLYYIYFTADPLIKATIIASLDTSTTSYTSGQLSSGHIYYYYVTAVNVFGESAQSNEIAVYVPTPQTSSPCTATANPHTGGLSLTVTFSVTCPAGVSTNPVPPTWYFHDPSNPDATGSGQTTTYTYSWIPGQGSTQHFQPTMTVVDGSGLSSSPNVPLITLVCTRNCPTSPSP